MQLETFTKLRLTPASENQIKSLVENYWISDDPPKFVSFSFSQSVLTLKPWVCSAVCETMAQKWYSLVYQIQTRWYQEVSSDPNDSVIMWLPLSYWKILKQKHLFKIPEIENVELLYAVSTICNSAS